MQYGNLKDTGDIVDLVIRYLKGDRYLKPDIETITTYYKENIKLYKGV
jgi:myo-inositol-hexaphosphate 3-phosphohydrolase